MLRASTAAIAFAFVILFTPALSADQASYKKIDDLGYKPGAGATLLPYVKSSDPQERWRAARALGNLRYRPAANAVVSLLDDPDPVVQTYAIAALGRLGDTSDRTINAIMSKAASADGRVARASLSALKKLAPGPDKLAAALEQVLDSDDQAVMSYAVDAMVEAGGRAVPLLQRALGNEKSAYWAALAIAEIGPDAAATAPQLAQLISTSDDPFTQQQALMAVAALGEQGRAALESVQDLANNTGEDGLRITASYALGTLGDPSSAGILQRLESEGGEFLKMVSVWSQCQIDKGNDELQQRAVTLLTQGLRSDRREVRDAAATGLARLGAPKDIVAPALLASLEGADDEQKSNIAEALASLGPVAVEKAIPALENPAFRDIAIEVIGRLGPEAGEAAGPLAALLPAVSEDQQRRINFALAAIGPGASKQGAAVVKGLASEDAGVRQSALFALRRLGPQDDATLHKIGEFYKASDSEFEKLAAAWAVAAMQPKDEALQAVVAALKPGLESGDQQTRFETVHAIAELGQGGAPFADKLRAMSDSDPDPAVRSLAGDVASGL